MASYNSSNSSSYNNPYSNPSSTSYSSYNSSSSNTSSYSSSPEQQDKAEEMSSELLVKEFINGVIDDMCQYMDDDTLNHLKNVLDIHLYGIELHKPSTELVVQDISSDEFKIRMFVASKKALNRSDSTLKQYVNEIHHMMDFINKPLEKITAMDIRYYFAIVKEQRHLSSASIQSKMRYLNSFFEFLASERLVEENPISKVGVIKTEKVIKKPFSAEELEALRNACRNPRDRAIIEFLYSTGVRVSELVSINIGDIDFSKQELIVLGKGNKERKTYITDIAKFYLTKYLELRTSKEDKEDWYNRPLFVSFRAPHKRMTRDGVEKMLNELGKFAGVSDVHPHRFRHTIATDLLNRGMPIEQVQRFLGHEQIETTLIYSEVKDEAVKSSHSKYTV